MEMQAKAAHKKLNHAEVSNGNVTTVSPLAYLHRRISTGVFYFLEHLLSRNELWNILSARELPLKNGGNSQAILWNMSDSVEESSFAIEESSFSSCLGSSFIIV